jgi:hypothetical protein
MSTRRRYTYVLPCACAALVAALAFGVPRLLAKDDAKADAKADAKSDARPAAARASDAKAADAKAATPIEGTPEWEKMQQPGKEHERLKALAGEFDAEVKWWMAPGGEAQSSKGKEKGEMILGGRYLQTHYQGEMMGKPFAGTMIMGYDNLKKKYLSTWVDNTSTGIMLAEGTADESGKVITMVAEIQDAATGKMEKFKQVTKIVDDKTHSFEMIVMPPGAPEFKVMEIRYKRVK